MSYDPQSTPPAPSINESKRPRNPSIANIHQGLQPIAVRTFDDATRHFVFKALNRDGHHVNFVYRRNIGEGHSQIERLARREKRNADYRSRREYRRARRLEALEAAEIVQQVAA